MSFEKKYESRVGERGLRLSGGERQRIAIARLFLRNPNIIMLDEATSALDTRTERRIQLAISELCKYRTTLVIAHRLSTITAADLILVFNEGKIVEKGTHDELVSKEQGIYSEMWKEQIRVEKLVSQMSKNDRGGRFLPEDDCEAATGIAMCKTAQTKTEPESANSDLQHRRYP